MVISLRVQKAWGPALACGASKLGQRLATCKKLQLTEPQLWRFWVPLLGGDSALKAKPVVGTALQARISNVATSISKFNGSKAKNVRMHDQNCFLDAWPFPALQSCLQLSAAYSEGSESKGRSEA